MLPKKELNIYPLNKSNLKALISHYFDQFEIDKYESLEYLSSKSSLQLNQIEFVLRKLSEAYNPIFNQELKTNIKLTNLFQYGFDALALSEDEWKGSKERIRITHKFKDFVKSSEIDIQYLETNN